MGKLPQTPLKITSNPLKLFLKPLLKLP